MLVTVGQMEGQKVALEKDYSLSILANRYDNHKISLLITTSKIMHSFKEFVTHNVWDARTKETV